MWHDRVFRWARSYWLDIVWVAFVGLNLFAMQVSPPWQTIPFLIIWVSLTALYGYRLWRLGSTVVMVTAVTLATGGLITFQVLKGLQDTEYLVEVPLLGAMFVIMVWHARRRQAALEEMKRVADHNLRLLERQRRFLQDASHELGTPITVALGHTELIQKAVADPAIAEDARVAADELLRLRRLASRLLLLASADGPDFLRLVRVDAGELVLEAISRWNHVPRRWSVGAITDATVEADRDSLTMALDALIENAVHHTPEDRHIELGVRRDGQDIVIGVADSGPGVPSAERERIFDRFSRTDPARSREDGGFGLGLAIVRAIAEAHGGSARVRSGPGQGATFELVLPGSPVVPESPAFAPGGPPRAFGEIGWTAAQVPAAMSAAQRPRMTGPSR
jgi:signal transduction histidine kinase